MSVDEISPLEKPLSSREIGESTVESWGTISTSASTRLSTPPPPDEEAGKNNAGAGAGAGADAVGNDGEGKDGESSEDEDDEDEDDSGTDASGSDYDSGEERDAFSMGGGDGDGDGDGDEDSMCSYSYASSASSVLTDSQSVSSDMGSSSALTHVEDNDKDSKDIAQREVRAARCGRTTALLFLAATLGALLPFAVYRITQSQQDQSFQLIFQALSDEIANEWQNALVTAFVALDAVAADASSTAAATAATINNQSWPLVNIQGFPIFSTQAHFASTALLSNSLAPIVTEMDRTEYELFVLSQHQGDTSTNTSRAQIYQVLNGVPIIASGPGPYYPIRYINPDDAQSINYDLASNIVLASDLNASTTDLSAVLGRLLDEKPESLLLESILLPRDSSSSSSSYSTTQTKSLNQQQLYGTMLYPILDTVNVKEAAGPVVASIVAVISWKDIFANLLLPSQAQGIACVIQNSCGQVATLQIDASNVQFFGFYDAHDTAFSSFGNTYNLQDFDLEVRTLANIPLNSNRADTCQYQLHVYPSSKTQQAYETFNPMLLAGILIGFFCLTLLVFLIYDCFLERRNRAILASAIEARAIVSSLFPANVRDRLFETNRVKRKKKKKKLKKLKKKMKKLRRKKKMNKNNKDGTDGENANDIHHNGNGNKDDASLDLEKAPGGGDNTPLSTNTVQSILDSANLGNSIRNLEQAWGNSLRDFSQAMTQGHGFVSHPKHQLKNLLASNHAAASTQLDHEEFGLLGKPIADLFPHTTVLFADIVGFTAWSSERAPEDVFTLLQTIYHAFDRIARRRGVFKVETIGDCYVAVTGLPDPQPDHPIRMTKFARECMTKMTEVTKKLEVALGPDTGDLVLRLGVNSGPVTAGVLQGEKSRFQLFGDTVNTASRMESTGERNKIHVSQSTADLLTKAGKGYWVKPREDLVHAKGKGNVQTFWLVSRSENFSIQPNKSTDDLDNDLNMKRLGPPRTRSMRSRGEPTLRGVKRTTSDSVRKLDRLSDSAIEARDDQREERLVQWQVELFTRLLKKIVAARVDASPPPAVEKPQKSENRRAVVKSTNSVACSFDYPSSLGPSVDNSVSLNISEHSISLNSRASSIVDRFSQREVVGGPPIRLAPRRNNSTTMLVPPMRRSSANSLDLSISTFHTSNGDLSMDGDVEVEPIMEPPPEQRIVVDEVVEAITLPKFNEESIKALDKASSVELDEEILTQLKDYISTMALMYRQNPFHNFEHASHVTMSANKLLNRIVAPENVDYERASGDIAEDLHDYTYGITSDPLTQFAVVFSALVHDCDHTGVPNGQLGKEHPDMAEYYRNQSLAEQNSVDLAWDLFMDPRYKKLQGCIAATDEEGKRFRQLVVNSVLATDIFDPKMKSLRNQRWDKAFHREQDAALAITEAVMEADRNMKATIVIEHIIQASDVAHTMQHWHIYQKWNERLFNEMYSAFECGRSKINPADGWYKGELWFFDNYIIPLAKKLKECGVFGVSSDEYLSYAESNRAEWCVKGEEIVAQMVERYNAKKFFVAGIAKKKHPNKRPVRRLPREAP